MSSALGPSEAADLIERFLNVAERYPQEWNDFVEASPVDVRVEPYRIRCYNLDPLVNRPVGPDPDAIQELKAIVTALRRM